MGDPYSWGLDTFQALALREAIVAGYAHQGAFQPAEGTMAHFILTGAGEVHQTVPPTSRVDPRPWLGLGEEAQNTLTTHPPVPVVPHMVETRRSLMSETTPVQRRDAWLELVAAMERTLLATRLNALAQRQLCEDVGEVSVLAMVSEWEATAWAAQRLLADIRSLFPPAVPVDDTLGQASILDLTPSTPVEAPVEDRPRRLLDAEGDLWEELEDGRWAYCPWGAEAAAESPWVDKDAGELWGPVRELEHVARRWGPLREPEGDQYHLGDRDD